MSAAPIEPEPGDILERAAKTGGEALADAYGWHADRGDYATARTVIISARPVIEAPLRAEIARLEAHYEGILRKALSHAERDSRPEWYDNDQQEYVRGFTAGKAVLAYFLREVLGEPQPKAPTT